MIIGVIRLDIVYQMNLINNNMNELQIVSYDQAKRLKDAGFDWPTTHFYKENNEKLKSIWDSLLHGSYPQNWNVLFWPECISAPTTDLALKWMRDVKGLLCHPAADSSGKWTGWHYSNDMWHHTDDFNSYEDAESELLDELLKLIEQ